MAIQSHFPDRHLAEQRLWVRCVPPIPHNYLLFIACFSFPLQRQLTACFDEADKLLLRLQHKVFRFPRRTGGLGRFRGLLYEPARNIKVELDRFGLTVGLNDLKTYVENLLPAPSHSGTVENSHFDLAQ